MQVAVITLFPGMFSALSEHGISGRALRDRRLALMYFNPRDYAADRHRTVDDKPYGGGPGMLMKTGPVSAAIDAAQARLKGEATVRSTATHARKARVIYLSPQGKPLQQGDVEALAREEDLVLLCGRYEGVDERIITRYVDDEFSLGDFVLSGGELAAMALLDAVIRLLPGALGDADSAAQDSFADGLLDHPHYTRPELFAGEGVPAVLRSGDHARIARWRLQQRLGATWLKRPDLLEGRTLSGEEQELLDAFIRAHRAGTGNDAGEDPAQ